MATGDITDPVDYGSIVRNNLMKRPGYAPYCGSQHMVRLTFDGAQFTCFCGYCTEFPDDFMAGYKARWHGRKEVGP
jgi:hypothetical protein